MTKKEKEHMLIIKDLAKRSGRPLPEVEKTYKNTLFYQMDILNEALRNFIHLLWNIIIKKHEKNKIY